MNFLGVGLVGRETVFYGSGREKLSRQCWRSNEGRERIRRYDKEKAGAPGTSSWAIEISFTVRVDEDETSTMS
jgi:hypothetical protein